MIASATELAGADSDFVKEFQLGVKYGEFATRFYLGDYWGVAADFAKFQWGQAVDKLTDLGTKKLLSAGRNGCWVFLPRLKIRAFGSATRHSSRDSTRQCKLAIGYIKKRRRPAFMNGWWGLL